MSRDWAGGSTYRWRRTRAAVLRANPRGRCVLDVGRHCQKHGRPCPGVCTGRAVEVHHAKGKGAGDDPSHLVPCCRACNLHVGRPTVTAPAPTPRSTW